MEFKDYLFYSEKTLSTQFHSDSKIEKVLHGVVGILTEADELLENYNEGKGFDGVNALEELGDITWYTAILFREFDFLSYQEVTVQKVDNPFKTSISILSDGTKLLDMMKKKLYYNKELKQEDFKVYSYRILSNVLGLCQYYNINIKDVYQRNIDKLRARYGEKFSSEKAINRDLDKERKILEGE